MSIFADLKFDSIVQTADKTRLDASRSFSAKGSAPIAKVEINPAYDEDATEEENDAGFIDVTGGGSSDWYLDWAFADADEQLVALRITPEPEGEEEPEPTTIIKTINVVDEDDDMLLSDDQDLIGLESDIMDYLPAGKASFLFMHRRAQGLILEFLDRTGYRDEAGARLTKAALVSKTEFNAWSKYMVLKLIFFDQSNQNDDNYAEKSKYYQELEEAARNRVNLPLDTDGDGEVSEAEQQRFDTIQLRVR